MKNVRKLVIWGILAGLFAAGPAGAQQSYQEYKGEIGSTRADMVKKRKLVVGRNLQLSDKEGKAFWSLYEKYRADMQQVGDRRVKLITDYADHYVSKTLTDTKAIELLKEAMDIDKQRFKVKEKYLPRFKEIMPPIQVVRFYQIENKMDAEVDFTLARQIPLVE